MRRSTVILMIISTLGTILQTSAQPLKATTTKKTFSRETSITAHIQADPTTVWTLLTNAADYPRWNSTIILIEGKIAAGEKIRLRSKLDPKRTFKLKIKEFSPESRLVWGDGQGKRVYTLKEEADGSTIFSMDEKIGGFMFPLYAKMIPSFDASFEEFATSLKKEAELIMKTK